MNEYHLKTITYRSYKNFTEKQFKETIRADCSYTEGGIRHIKKVTSDTKFSFHHILLWETFQTIIELNKNKATSGNIPTKTLKTIPQDVWVPMTDCINSAILNGLFPDELKSADATPLYKKSDPEDKTYYRPISVLPSLSKLYEKYYINN